MSISGPFHSTRFEIIRLSQIGCSISREKLKHVLEEFVNFFMETFAMCDMILYLLDFKLPKVNPVRINRAAFDSISATGYKIESNSEGSVQKMTNTIIATRKSGMRIFCDFFIIHKKVQASKIASSPQISSNAIISYSSK